VTVRLVIFDCDGVLFESEHANVAFYNEVLRSMGEPPLRDDSEAACHALSSAQLFEKYYADRPELAQRLQQASRETSYEPFYSLMQPREQLVEFLVRLRSRYSTAMATNRGKTTKGVLAHFGLTPLFDLAVGVLDVANPKPHPDMLLKCLAHFELSPDAAIYVGDQAGDAAAAAAAGMRFVAFGKTLERAEHRIAALEELEPLLERF